MMSIAMWSTYILILQILFRWYPALICRISLNWKPACSWVITHPLKTATHILTELLGATWSEVFVQDQNVPFTLAIKVTNLQWFIQCYNQKIMYRAYVHLRTYTQILVWMSFQPCVCMNVCAHDSQPASELEQVFQSNTSTL